MPRQSNHRNEPTAAWSTAMDAARRATLREHLLDLVSLAVIVASIVTFLVALFSGASQ